MQALDNGIVDFTFVNSIEEALRLLQPILEVLQSMAKDKPLVSQLLPVWLSTWMHICAWAEFQLSDLSELQSVSRKRFDKCVHPAMYAAYWVDPVSGVPNEEESGYVPDSKKIAVMDRTLGPRTS